MKDRFEKINVAAIAVKENPRKKFNENGIKELAQDIKSLGLLHPICVMEQDENFVLVYGERRLRAVKLLGFEKVSARIIPNTTKLKFNSIQIAENLLREDVHPLDEADSILKMMEEGGKKGAIAKYLGKSISFINNRLALLGLVDQAKEDFRDGIMSIEHALILCQLPHEEQNLAINQIENRQGEEKYFEHPNELRRFLDRTILRSLENAPFDISDKNLLTGAGACGSCPKQTGNCLKLFGEIDQGSRCMDSKCFIKKIQASKKKGNQKLLEEFNLTEEKCIPVATGYYTEEGEVKAGKWKKVDKEDVCKHTTLGRSQGEIFRICTNQKCNIHFPKETFTENGREVSKNGIPLDENAYEKALRIFNKKKVKEDVDDKEKAIIDTGKKLIDLENDFKIIDKKFVLKYLVNGLSDSEMDFIGSIEGIKKEEMGYYKRIELKENLLKCEEEKIEITIRKVLVSKIIKEWHIDNRMEISKYGVDFNISFMEVFQNISESRKEERKIKQHEIEKLKQKEEAKKDKYLKVFKNAGTETPMLERAKNLSVEDLEKWGSGILIELNKKIGAKVSIEMDSKTLAEKLIQRINELQQTLNETQKEELEKVA